MNRTQTESSETRPFLRPVSSGDFISLLIGVLESLARRLLAAIEVADDYGHVEVLRYEDLDRSRALDLALENVESVPDKDWRLVGRGIIKTRKGLPKHL